MTDKQIIECKYKFQSIEKFAGKPYCTLHNETCEFINFACDKNCQVYEDYKQLKAKEQELQEAMDNYVKLDNQRVKEYNELVDKYNNKEQECEELKAKIEYVFSDASPNFDNFCDICVAKDSCNGNCCFEQIKELIYEIE